MKLIYAAVTDLFFMAKIQAAAKQTGSLVVFAGSYEELAEKIEGRPPQVVIVDLNGPLTLGHIQHIRAKYGVRIIGYLSHVQTDLAKDAKKVCEVMSQADFFMKLPDILS